MSEEIHIPINSNADIVIARQRARELAARLDFSSCDLTLIVTAISELARNIYEYAKQGEIIFLEISNMENTGLEITAHDDGPGISDLDQAMQDGYSTSAGLGLGLPGVRRLMDEFEITSAAGQGTTVKVVKWHQKTRIA